MPDEIMRRHGFPTGSGKGNFESACIICHHCGNGIVLNPDRSRPRGYCRKCDHYLCDECEAKRFLTGVCYPFKARLNDLGNAALGGKEVDAQAPRIVVP
jgi:hypothetical protein